MLCFDETVCSLLAPLCGRVRPFPQEFKPGLFDARIMLGCIYQIQKGSYRKIKTKGKLWIGNTALRIKSLVRLRQREHIRKNSRA